MLDREFDLDVERLGQERGDDTSFFAFADTVVARSYRGTNDPRDAVALSREAFNGARKQLPRMHSQVANATVLIAAVLCAGLAFA